MTERIQNILIAEMQLAKQIQDRRRLAGLKDLAKRVARAKARGWFTGESGISLPVPEQLVEVRKFHSDQLAGLKEVGWTFSMEAQPVSIGQLYDDEATKPLFGFVNESRQMRDVVPVARGVAINPNLNPDSREAIFLPNSGNLPFNDQQGELETYVRKLRKKNLKTGTLDGVDFAIDRTSIYAQFDFKYQRKFGRKLIVGGWARTIDETFVDLEFDSGLADVGRSLTDRPLGVDAWGARFGHPRVGVVPVATPTGNR